MEASPGVRQYQRRAEPRELADNRWFSRAEQSWSRSRRSFHKRLRTCRRSRRRMVAPVGALQGQSPTFNSTPTRAESEADRYLPRESMAAERSGLYGKTVGFVRIARQTISFTAPRRMESLGAR